MNTKKHLIIKNHKATRKITKGEICGTNFLKNILPKESTNTKKVKNATNLISQSEPPAPKYIMVEKIRTDISVLSGVIGDIVTPEKHIPRKKGNMKQLVTYPTRKDPTPNQDINTLGTLKDQSLSP